MYSRASSASQKSLLDRSGQKLSFICSWWRKNNPDAESKWGLRVCYVKRRVPLYVSVCVGVGWTSPVRFTSISTAIGIPCTATHDHRHKPAGEPQSTVSWSWLGHGRSKEREMVRKMKEKWGRQLVPTNRLLSDFLTSDFFSLYLGLSLPHFHPPLPTHFQTFFSHHAAVSPSVGLAHRFTCCSITGGRGRPGWVCFLIWALLWHHVPLFVSRSWLRVPQDSGAAAMLHYPSVSSCLPLGVIGRWDLWYRLTPFWPKRTNKTEGKFVLERIRTYFYLFLGHIPRQTWYFGGHHLSPFMPSHLNFSVLTKKVGVKRIWLMHISSLYIHDYFLESIRQTWLIQVVILIEVLSVSAADFPSIPLTLSVIFCARDLCPAYFPPSLL